MFASRRIATSGSKFEDNYSLHYLDTSDRGEISQTTFNVHNSTYTFAFWIKRNAVDSYDAVIGNSAKTNRDFILFNDANTYLHLEGDTNGDSLVWVNAMEVDRWYHYVITTDGSGSGACYRDGIALAFHASSSYHTIGTALIDIDRIGFPNPAVDGKLNDLAIYNAELTQAQAISLYNGREPYNHKEGPMSKNLIHWWRFGDGTENGSGTTMYDMAGSLNATLVNAPVYQGDVPW